jgi:hypothetical protein
VLATPGRPHVGQVTVAPLPRGFAVGYRRRLRPALVKLEECVFAVQRLPAATLSRISELAGCSMIFLPADPARTGRIAYWRADGAEPPSAPGSVEELTVVDTGAHPLMVQALLMPVPDALPVLTRARFSPHASPSAAFWGAAALLALQLTARGRMLPGLTGTDTGRLASRTTERRGPGAGPSARRLHAAHRARRSSGPGPVQQPGPGR